MPTVLIADDEVDLLESTALLVESLGYKAIRVSEGDDILSLAREQRPDLILQDVKMPRLNLAGLVSALRSDPATASIPFVLYGSGRDVGSQAVRHNAWGYLTKPFMKGELSRLLTHVFAQHGIKAERDVAREVATLFTDIWDLVAATSNYTRLLEIQKGLPEGGHRAVRGLQESLLKLETRLTRLRTYITGLVASIEPIPGPERPERPERSRTRGEARPPEPGRAGPGKGPAPTPDAAPAEDDSARLGRRP